MDDQDARSEVIRRALEIAMSGRFFSHEDIVKALELEGFAQARRWLDEDALRVELKELSERGRSRRPAG